jgi:hypothetical protein
LSSLSIKSDLLPRQKWANVKNLLRRDPRARNRVIEKAHASRLKLNEREQKIFLGWKLVKCSFNFVRQQLTSKGIKDHHHHHQQHRLCVCVGKLTASESTKKELKKNSTKNYSKKLNFNGTKDNIINKKIKNHLIFSARSNWRIIE